MDEIKIAEIYELIEKFGPSIVPTKDLISLIIAPDCLDLAKFPECFGLRDLIFLDFKQLKSELSFSDVIIFKLLAAVELGNRTFQNCQLKFGEFTSSSKVGETSLKFFENVYQECLVGFFLDINRNLIQRVLLFKGSLNKSLAFPREVLSYVLKNHAYSFILVHNHPSGSCKVSKADIIFTKRMERAAKIMGIHFDDHLIIGAAQYLSLREENILK